MEIQCPKCNRSFKIDKSLIPEKGRLLQCGTCNHKWFFKNIIHEMFLSKNKNDININEENILKKPEIDNKNTKS